MSIPIEIITGETEITRAGFHWRERDGVRALACTPLEQDGFANGFSTRLGGVSRMPHEALNLAGFNDDAAPNIYENRRRFLRLFDGEWTLAAGWQVHGADVRVVRTAQDALGPTGALGETEHCDALVTNAPHVLVGVKTADCVPILLGDTRRGAAAAIHAGWRGTLAQIVSCALRRMRQEYDTRPENVRAAIGPSALACCYEVGSEVIEAFQARFAEADALLTPTREGHALIDLQRANRNQLIAEGVGAERIHQAPLCTMCRTDLFFSYRREKSLHGRVGRLMSVIGKG
jgi:hypothetical protein